MSGPVYPYRDRSADAIIEKYGEAAVARFVAEQTWLFQNVTRPAVERQVATWREAQAKPNPKAGGFFGNEAIGKLRQ
jgi:hypothetical protein